MMAKARPAIRKVNVAWDSPDLFLQWRSQPDSPSSNPSLTKEHQVNKNAQNHHGDDHLRQMLRIK